jgi:hypothetical protein
MTLRYRIAAVSLASIALLSIALLWTLMRMPRARLSFERRPSGLDFLSWCTALGAHTTPFYNTVQTSLRAASFSLHYPYCSRLSISFEPAAESRNVSSVPRGTGLSALSKSSRCGTAIRSPSGSGVFRRCRKHSINRLHDRGSVVSEIDIRSSRQAAKPISTAASSSAVAVATPIATTGARTSTPVTMPATIAGLSSA